jgi:2'-5' RNA ligase
MGRYAIYFAPPAEGALWRLGSGLLGYDAVTGEALPLTVPPGFAPEEWRAATQTARQYGFHATIKAPFTLKDGRREDELRAALRDFARSRKPFSLKLRPVSLDGFVALTPEDPPAGLAELERDAVLGFEAFRAPLSEAQLAKRLKTPLMPRQRELLDCYGYPYVLDQFRFHMTLSDRLDTARQARVLAFLAERDEASQTIAIDRLALFHEGAKGFVILANERFGG